MRTIEQICEDLTGVNSMAFMRGTDEEFQTFFEENSIEWVRELLKKYNGNWEVVPSPKDLIESFLGDKKIDLEKLKRNFYSPEYNGSLMVFEDGSSVFYDQNTRYTGSKKCIGVPAFNEPDDGDFEDWYDGEFYK